MKFLIGSGVKHFVFPLGFRGEVIKEYIENNFSDQDLTLEFFYTGDDAPIHRRIEAVIDSLKDCKNFVLLNSDTIFDFNLNEMKMAHINGQNLLTLSTVPVTSPGHSHVGR